MTAPRREEASAGGAPRRIERRPDPADVIRFGTSGWRGTLGEEITFPRLRRLVRGISDWIRAEERGESVLIGWDGRFASRLMAERAAHVFFDEGITPVLASRLTPTPAMTHALSRASEHAFGGGCVAAAIVLTASHNPAPDHGLKVFRGQGAAITDVEAARIEAAAEKRRSEDRAIPEAAAVQRFDFTALYEQALVRLLDRDQIRRSGIEVVYDAMHGAGGGLLDSILVESGAQVKVLRGEIDPYFGGGLPDPQEARLESLRDQVRQRSAGSQRVQGDSGLVLGLATDGDGDRLGVVDATGRVLSETQMIALLVDYLASAGRITQGVAMTEATGSLVEHVATSHGLPIRRYPVGFKHLSAAMAAGEADVAGEESGGFALGSMGLDKDGLLAALFMVEMVASSGEGVEARIARLEAEWGTSACGRTAVERNAKRDEALVELGETPPVEIGGVSVSAVSNRGGLRLGLSDGGFLIFRRSGTEPLIRVYGEAKSPEALAARLDQGCALLEG